MSILRDSILLNQSELAGFTGLTQPAIHYILNGDRSPTTETAETLEAATGICREAWVFPERHYNPYIPMIDPLECRCFICPNREWRSYRVLSYGMNLLQNPSIDPLRTVKWIMKCQKEMGLHHQDTYVVIYERDGENLKKLVSDGVPLDPQNAEVSISVTTKHLWLATRSPHPAYFNRKSMIKALEVLEGRLFK